MFSVFKAIVEYSDLEGYIVRDLLELLIWLFRGKRIVITQQYKYGKLVFSAYLRLHHVVTVYYPSGL